MPASQEQLETIKSLVYRRPRTINELATALDINWRTADRYVDTLIKKTGLIEKHTFRGSGRGSMKIVFWSNREHIYSTEVQEELFKQVEQGVEKSDFSPLEIYQYVIQEKRRAYMQAVTKNYEFDAGSLVKLLQEAQEEICVFAGNVAWIHFTHKNKPLLHYVRELLQRGVKIRILSRIHLQDLENIKKLLALNAKYAEERIELRHAITPIRCYVIDEEIAKFSEVESAGNRPGQAQQDMGVYYEIRDETWVTWIQQLFFTHFQKAVPVNKRLDALQSIQRV